MIYDYFRVTGAHDTVLDYADLFSIILRDDNIQEFDTRWDEVLLLMTKIPSNDILESLYKLRIRVSAQLKTVLDLYEMEIHLKISMPNYQKLKTMVKRRKIRNSDFETLTPRTGKSKQVQWKRVERDQSALKEAKVYVTSRKKKASVRRETSAVSATKPKIVRKNQNTLPPQFPSHQRHEVEVCRRKAVSAKVTMVPFSDNRADII